MIDLPVQRSAPAPPSLISEAYGPGMRVLEFTHKVMQPTKDEQKGYGIGGPTRQKFNRPGDAVATSPDPPPVDPGPDVVDANGTPYVEAE